MTKNVSTAHKTRLATCTRHIFGSAFTFPIGLRESTSKPRIQANGQWQLSKRYAQKISMQQKRSVANAIRSPVSEARVNVLVMVGQAQPIYRVCLRLLPASLLLVALFTATLAAITPSGFVVGVVARLPLPFEFPIPLVPMPLQQRFEMVDESILGSACCATTARSTSDFRLRRRDLIASLD